MPRRAKACPSFVTKFAHNDPSIESVRCEIGTRLDPAHQMLQPDPELWLPNNNQALLTA